MDPVMDRGTIPDDTLTLKSPTVRSVEERVRQVDSLRDDREQCLGVGCGKTLEL